MLEAIPNRGKQVVKKPFPDAGWPGPGPAARVPGRPLSGSIEAHSPPCRSRTHGAGAAAHAGGAGDYVVQDAVAGQ